MAGRSGSGHSEWLAVVAFFSPLFKCLTLVGIPHWYQRKDWSAAGDTDQLHFQKPCGGRAGRLQRHCGSPQGRRQAKVQVVVYDRMAEHGSLLSYEREYLKGEVFFFRGSEKGDSTFQALWNNKKQICCECECSVDERRVRPVYLPKKVHYVYKSIIHFSLLFKMNRCSFSLNWI